MTHKNKPPRSHPTDDANQRRLERLKGSVLGYTQPFEPIDTDEWEALFDETSAPKTRCQKESHEHEKENDNGLGIKS